MKSTKVQNPRRRGTHFIRLSPVQSLLRCFRCSRIRFLHSTVLYCLGYIARLRFTFRWEGMAAFTNCSSAVLHCGHTFAQFVVHREQRSTLKLTTRHLADAHALRKTVSPTYARAPWIACSGKRPTYARARWIARVSFFACFHAISLEHSRFGKIATLLSIFSLFTTR